MKRVPEPEVMDDAEQALAYARADFAEVNTGFVNRFLDLCGDDDPQRILDLGCGPADIPIRLCGYRPGVSVCAVDASHSMLALGRKAVDEKGLQARVGLVQAYLPDLPLPASSVDAVISNSLLHHLADPMDLWRSVVAVGRPWAQVLVCDLFRPESRAAARQIVDDADCSDSEILQTDFFNSLLAAYTPAEVRQQLDAAGLRQLKVKLVSERHLVVSGRL